MHNVPAVLTINSLDIYSNLEKLIIILRPHAHDRAVRLHLCAAILGSVWHCITN